MQRAISSLAARVSNQCGQQLVFATHRPVFNPVFGIVYLPNFSKAVLEAVVEVVSLRESLARVSA